VGERSGTLRLQLTGLVLDDLLAAEERARAEPAGLVHELDDHGSGHREGKIGQADALAGHLHFGLVHRAALERDLRHAGGGRAGILVPVARRSGGSPRTSAGRKDRLTDQLRRGTREDAECVVGAARRVCELRLARRRALGPAPGEPILAAVAAALHQEARFAGRAAGRRREQTAAHARVVHRVAQGRAGRRPGLAYAGLAGGLLAVAEQAVVTARPIGPDGAVERAAVTVAAKVSVVALLARVDDGVPARAAAAAQLRRPRNAAGAEDGMAVRRRELDAARGGGGAS